MHHLFFILFVIFAGVAMRFGCLAQDDLVDRSAAAHDRTVREGFAAPDSRFTPKGLAYRRRSVWFLLAAFGCLTIWVLSGA
jgi:hypothetical protein